MMDRTFPFGFPGATAFYLTIYVLTLVIHVLFMNYVLAGTGYLLFCRWRDGSGSIADRGLRAGDVLRDWMPFALSGAITAGVAPLLFVQILYKENFYTANLLLYHRWMVILPVLIIGFYMLYLLKTQWIERRSALTRGVVTLGALFCFAFTGLSWTENHLLSTDTASWPGLYESGSMVYYHRELLPRLGMWAVGSIPTMALLVAWQLYVLQRSGQEPNELEPRRLALLAVVGIALSVGCAGLYGYQMTSEVRSHVTGVLAGPFLLAGVVGLVIQIVAWLDQGKKTRFCPRALAAGSAGLLLTIIGMTTVREAIRLASIDVTPLYVRHAESAEKGGLYVFLAFFGINAVLVAWAIRLTRSRVVHSAD